MLELFRGVPWAWVGAWLLWGLFVLGLGLASLGFRQVWFRASLIQGLFGLSLAFVFAFFQDLTSLGGFPWACLGSASLGFDWVRFRAWSICASLIGFGSWLGFFRLCFACLGWYRA